MKKDIINIYTKENEMMHSKNKTVLKSSPNIVHSEDTQYKTHVIAKSVDEMNEKKSTRRKQIFVFIHCWTVDYASYGFHFFFCLFIRRYVLHQPNTKHQKM